MGLDNLWKPDLRGRIEQGISRIAAGLVSKQEVRKGLTGPFKSLPCLQDLLGLR
jgi:hypothetical protein